MKNKSMLIKYAICIPLLILFAVLAVLAVMGKVPEFWVIVSILVVGVCVTVLRSELTLFPPKKGQRKINPPHRRGCAFVQPRLQFCLTESPVSDIMDC